MWKFPRYMEIRLNMPLWTPQRLSAIALLDTALNGGRRFGLRLGLLRLGYRFHRADDCAGGRRHGNGRGREGGTRVFTDALCPFSNVLDYFLSDRRCLLGRFHDPLGHFSNRLFRAVNCLGCFADRLLRAGHRGLGLLHCFLDRLLPSSPTHSERFLR